MAKDNLKLISVRIDPDTLEKIDQFVHKHYYWKRNTFINRVLESVLQHFDEESIFQMVRGYYEDSAKVEATFKIH